MFRCPRCNRSSTNPSDEAERYCGHCHLYVNDKLALLYFTWSELETIGKLIDAEILPVDPSTSPARWSELNSLRTAVREAQWGVRTGA